jgi:hypothetical protein
VSDRKDLPSVLAELRFMGLMGLLHPIRRVLKSELPHAAPGVAMGMRAALRRRGMG